MEIENTYMHSAVEWRDLLPFIHKTVLDRFPYLLLDEGSGLNRGPFSPSIIFQSDSKIPFAMEKWDLLQQCSSQHDIKQSPENPTTSPFNSSPFYFFTHWTPRLQC